MLPVSALAACIAVKLGASVGNTEEEEKEERKLLVKKLSKVLFCVLQLAPTRQPEVRPHPATL